MTAAKRKELYSEYPIVGCRKMHLISVDIHGNFATRNILRSDEINLLSSNFEVNELEKMNDVFEDNCDDVIDKDMLYEIIEPGTYIGLRTPSSLELFYLFRVISKDVAPEHMVDRRGHGVTNGEKYITGIYLEK